MATYILFDSASGYALFERTGGEEIGERSFKLQAQIQDFKYFAKDIHLKAFLPFESAENALENINNLSEGILHDTLKNFLEINLPKNKSLVLGVVDDKIGLSIKDALNLKIERSQHINEITRAIRLHFGIYLRKLAGDAFNVDDLRTAQRGLAHAYSRSKVKFNINKADNMIINSICLLDQLDKDVNGFSMRLREWYSRHFPELGKIVIDNILYARCAQRIGSRSNLDDDVIPDLAEITGDEDKARQIIQAGRASMGTDISQIDLMSIERFAKRVVRLAEHRESIQKYLYSRMNEVAPNLSSLIGEVIGARLINHAGSLTKLSKYPASTVQILGAEKALFRALKSRGNTPKYGHIFNSGFISRAKQKDKGRISRYLANKCSIASRFDAFSDVITNVYGSSMKSQVEERLHFYETGEPPAKNIDVMKNVLAQLGSSDDNKNSTPSSNPQMDLCDEEENIDKLSPSKSKKRQSEMNLDQMPSKSDKSKKEKSKKHRSKHAKHAEAQDV